MNVLFVGWFYPAGFLKTVNQDGCGRIVFSNHNFEQSLLNGFRNHPEHVYRAVTLPNVGSFPLKNKHLQTHRERYSMEGIPVESIGFCDLWPVFTLSGVFQLVHVLNRETGKRTNQARTISIGRHVWLAGHAVVLKGSVIPDDCIIGNRSSVIGKLPFSHSIYAGIPARLVREGVTWDRFRLHYQQEGDE